MNKPLRITSPLGIMGLLIFVPSAKATEADFRCAVYGKNSVKNAFLMPEFHFLHTIIAISVVLLL